MKSFMNRGPSSSILLNFAGLFFCQIHFVMLKTSFFRYQDGYFPLGKHWVLLVIPNGA